MPVGLRGAGAALTFESAPFLLLAAFTGAAGLEAAGNFAACVFLTGCVDLAATGLRGFASETLILFLIRSTVLIHQF